MAVVFTLGICLIFIANLLPLDSAAIDWKVACSLPPESGPCMAYFENWYYDSTAKECKTLIYGGCKGNNNRFRTKEDCESKCKVDKKPSHSSEERNSSSEAPCIKQLKNVKPGLIGSYKPQCDEQGFYKPRQCWGSTGQCWCVTEYGDKVTGVDCDQPCFNSIKRAFSPILVHGIPLRTSDNIPSCDEDGFFSPKQCQKEQCWCVDKFGREIKHTRKDGDRNC